MLTAIRNRLSDFHKNYIQGYGFDREQTSKREGEELCSVASELGLLKRLDSTIDSLAFDVKGSEHAVSYNDHFSLIKVTLPDTGFGLVPKVTNHRKINIHTNQESFYQQIEFLGATPLEYLDRWAMCNELFSDTVNIERIIQWVDSSISIMISQPYYMGEVVSHDEIHYVFKEKGWEPIYKDGRAIFYNFAYDAIALDLEPRNCYLSKGRLQPFDLILSHPDDEMRKYLGLDLI